MDDSKSGIWDTDWVECQAASLDEAAMEERVVMDFILKFNEVGLSDVPLVGGKNASLGEMHRNLTTRGITVPDGFCITARAYDHILDEGRIRGPLTELLRSLDTSDTEELARVGRECRSLIKQAGLPDKLKEEICRAYDELSAQFDPETDVAVRSSATAEDLPDASFAGQQESFLNIRGRVALLEACLNCFASLFTDRAISYRVDKGFDHMSVKLSIGVQKMVRSDTGASGVIFTLDTESGFRDAVLVTSAYGLGENVVAGRVDPDEFIVFKTTLKRGFSPIVRRRVGGKHVRMIYSGHGTRTTRNVEVTPEERASFSISDDEVIKLSRWACEIEEYYSSAYERSTAMDIEWAKDGRDGALYIVQARPETVHSTSDHNIIENYHIESSPTAILTGRAIGSKIGAGAVKKIRSVHELANFPAGAVLVAEMTDPDWEPVMKKASAIVTNRGGRTCHAAIVSREIGVPCIVGTERATECLEDGRVVTICCAEGDEGRVYDGRISFTKQEIDLERLPSTVTKIMVNVGNPERAFSLSSLPVAGVGLARQEFIVSNEVRIHPQAIAEFDSLTDQESKRNIDEICRGYSSREEYYVVRLAEGVGSIAAAFYPRPVIVRLSDFKTNEYANLIGGAQFEPVEDNPMIGFRGASRYLSPSYRQAFAMECAAMKRIRSDMGLDNVILMVPFCRTVEEAKKVLEQLSFNGLVRGEDGLEIYMMCEIPSNVLLMNKFAELFDGFSIGSNDLTQLILGVDRDSEILSTSFDERNDAVKLAVEMAVKAAHEAGRKIGICGQAPSDYPDFARFLVDLGIDSMSLSEDVVVKTILLVANQELQGGALRSSRRAETNALSRAE